MSLRKKLSFLIVTLALICVASCSKTSMLDGTSRGGPHGGGNLAGNGNGEPILGALRYLSAYPAPSAPTMAEFYKLAQPAPLCGGTSTFVERITDTTPRQRFSNACNGNAQLSFDPLKFLTFGSPFALNLDGTGSIFSFLSAGSSFNRPAPLVFGWDPASPSLAVVISANGSTYEVISYFMHQGVYYTTRPAAMRFVPLGNNLMIVGHVAQVQFTARLNEHYGTFINDPIYKTSGTAYAKVEETPGSAGPNDPTITLPLPNVFPVNISNDLEL